MLRFGDDTVIEETDDVLDAIHAALHVPRPEAGGREERSTTQGGIAVLAEGRGDAERSDAGGHPQTEFHYRDDRR